jgi:hypothetical protein
VDPLGPYRLNGISDVEIGDIDRYVRRVYLSAYRRLSQLAGGELAATGRPSPVGTGGDGCHPHIAATEWTITSRMGARYPVATVFAALKCTSLSAITSSGIPSDMDAVRRKARFT